MGEPRPDSAGKLTGWAGPGRDAYQRARDRGLKVVFRSAEPGLLALRQAVTEAADAGEPFHVVHFDGHGVMRGRSGGGGAAGARPA